MHRSGTSAITRAISLLGADLPSDLMGAVPDNNEAGFWESIDVYRINDEILASGGSRWDDWRRFDAEWYRSPAPAEFKARALDILRRDFAHSALFVLKDPRICRLLPFWLEVFEAFGVTVKHVLPLRNPLEVAASLRKRDGLSVPRSLIVWLRHVLEAEAVTRGHPRAFVTYDQLLSDWRGVIAALSERLEIPWPRRSATAGIQIDAFLGQRYRHHTVQASELDGRREVPEWIRVTYGTLLQLASEGESESLHERLDEVHRQVDAASDIFSVVIKADEVVLEETRTEREGLGGHVQHLKLELARFECDVGRQHDRITQLEAACTTQDRLVSDLQTALGERTGRVGELEALVAQQRERLVEGAEEHRALTARLHSLQSSAAWQLAYPLRSVEHRWPRVARGMAGVQRAARSAMTLSLREEMRLGRAARSILQAGLFDEGWFVGNNTDVVLRGSRPIYDWLTHGWREGRDPHPLFGTSWYLEQYPDVAAAHINPLIHYLGTGGREGRDPHPLFDSSWYLEQYPDVVAAGINPLAHFLRSGGAEGRNPHPLFDSSWYQERYPDVRAAGVNPLVHYLTMGAAEGRDPHRLFATSWYLERHPGVRAAGINPLVHYVTKGAAEGHDPHPLFSGSWYLQQNPDVAAAGLHPLLHYLQAGVREGRDPHPVFDSAWYLEQNPDVGEAGAEPFTHYLHTGARERRDPHPLFDSTWYLEQHPQGPDVTANLLVHYLVCGAKAGLDPHPLFDGSWYLQQNPAVARAGINPLVHYLQEGAAAGCNPNPLFDTATYAAANLPGAPVSQALTHFAAGKRLVAAGAYRNADVLLALQSELRARTETQLVRDRRDQPRPFAVFLQCGHGSVHPRWLTSAPRNWDLIVNHYDSTFLDRIDCDVELVQAGELAGTKFTAVCSMLRQWPALLRAYDFILLLDDDIYIELGDIEKLFTTAVENGLDLAQASLSPDSACAHEVFLTQRRNGLRYVSAVEIMMPLLSRRALDVVDPLFCQSISGWGIDVALAHLLRERYGSNFAVLDGVVARHTKPIDTEEGSYYKMLRGARIYPELELGHLQALYGTSLCFQEVSHLG